MNLTIDKCLKERLPNFFIIAYAMDVINQTSDEVTNLLEKTYQKYCDFVELIDVVNLPKIKEARDSYKRLGKDPSRYRLATEALIRRVLRKMPLYRLGDLIDLGNILSIETRRSICVVDLDKIKGDIIIRIGQSNDLFEAINRGILNIEKIPVYTDALGPFGTPTSDTYRTAVTNETKRLLVMMICFNEEEALRDETILLDLYQTYAKATKIKKLNVR